MGKAPWDGSLPSGPADPAGRAGHATQLWAGPRLLRAEGAGLDGLARGTCLALCCGTVAR